MGKKQKRSSNKKLSSKVAANKKSKAGEKSAGTTAPTTVSTRVWDWDFPVLFLMLVIIAIPVLGPTRLLLGSPSHIRLSFLLPVVPLLLLYIGYKKSAITMSFQPVMLALWGIVIVAAVSFFWAENAYGVISSGVKWLYVVLLSTAVYSLAQDVDRQHRIFIALALAGGYMALIGVTQYLFGHEIYSIPSIKYPWPSATSGHKNMASQFVVMTLPFALYLSLNSRSTIGYNLANLLIALMLGYLVYGRARQALIAVTVQFLILLAVVLFKRSRRLLQPHILSRDYFLSIMTSSAIFLALILAPPFDKPFSWERTAVKEFASRGEVFTQSSATLQQMSNGRIATWMKTTSMIKDNPEGVGLNNFMVHYDRYNAESGDYYLPLGNQVWTNAHNDYLQLLAELGLPAVLIAGLLLYGLFKIYRQIFTKGDDTSRQRSLIIGMGLMGLFTTMMFSFPLTRTAAPMLLGIYLAMLAAMASFSLSSKREKRWAFTPLMGVILILVSLVSFYVSYRELTGRHYGSIANSLVERIFKPAKNNPWATQELMIYLGETTDKAIQAEPYAPVLLRNYIAIYTNLSVSLEDQALAEMYRVKALEAAERHLSMWPYDSRIHALVAARMQVPTEKAMHHIGRAIELDPGNLQLYDFLRDIAFPSGRFDEILYYFEHYIPRFYHRGMTSNYAYLGSQAKQEARAIKTLQSIDLSRKYARDSEQYSAERQFIDQLIASLEQNL